MNITRNEVKPIFDFCNAKHEGYPGYALIGIAKLRLSLIPTVKDIESRTDPKAAYSESSAAYNAGIQDIVKKYAEKDDKGEVIQTANGVRVIDIKAVTDEIATWDEINVEAKATYEAEAKALNEWLSEAIEIVPIKVKSDFFDAIKSDDEARVLILITTTEETE